MTNSIRNIKRAQKERHLQKILSELFQQTIADNSGLTGLFVSRVQLSPDKRTCTVYFYSLQGKAHFDSLLDTLKLYKPSLRKAVATHLSGKYVPDFRFTFDDQYEKQEAIEKLFEKIKAEDA